MNRNLKAILPLQKSVNYYDYWVYIGKESYGSKHAIRASLKPGTKFFDVLGRAYDKMKARIKYYVRKDAVKREEFETQFEFEVYGRIVKDSEGNDIQVFVKEDKRNGFRRDSIFYYNGHWETYEIENESKIILRNSLGTVSYSIHDNEGKLLERVIKDSNEKNIVSKKYIWENGILTQIIGLDGVQSFLYGESPYEDTVKVIPSDKIQYSHDAYDGSVGKIPRKDDARYKYYLMDPYGIVPFDFENNSSFIIHSPYVSSSNIYVLKKNSPDLTAGMPEPTYINTPWTDTSSAECRTASICPPKFDPGKANLKPILVFDLEEKNSYKEKEPCVCESGDYIMDKYSIKFIKPIIALQQSFLARRVFKGPNGELWERRCLTKKEIQSTYDHEVQHFVRAYNKMLALAVLELPKGEFKNMNDCKKAVDEARDIITKKIDNWIEIEQRHDDPNGPQNTGYKLGEVCEN